MPNNSQTKSTQSLTQEFEDLNNEIKQEDAKINKELGLFAPKNISIEMESLWQNFFTLIRKMYTWELFYKEHVKKFLFDFFEIGRELNGQKTTEEQEIKIKKLKLDDLWKNINQRIESKKSALEMLYLNDMNEFFEDYYTKLTTDQEKIEFLTYLNNGVIPDEVQALIDERDAGELEETQLSPEETAALQKSTIERIFSQYNSGKGKLNLGKGGVVVSAEAIDEFINQEENEEVELLRSQTRIRTLPNLPDTSQNQVPSLNSTYLSQNPSQNNVQNVGQNNIVNSNFANQNTNSNPNQNQINPNFANQNSQTPQNNISNFRSNSQVPISQNSNTQNSRQNPPNLPNNSNYNANNLSNFQSQQNDLNNPKAIPPRTRGLSDLLKK